MSPTSFQAAPLRSADDWLRTRRVPFTRASPASIVGYINCLDAMRTDYLDSSTYPRRRKTNLNLIIGPVASLLVLGVPSVELGVLLVVNLQ